MPIPKVIPPLLRIQIDEARETLSSFIDFHAEQTAEAIGFRFVPTRDAPNTYSALCTAFERSIQTKEPLPISNQNSGSVLFTSPEVNIAHRFVHDIHHCLLGLSFDLVDELELAIWHLDQLERSGYAPNSLPWKLFHADLIGQIQINALANRFPADQRSFGINCAVMGLERGVLHELRNPS
ncbi:hypothetical protein [Rhodococcus sp. NPDC060176]|uniref:hypothetical protein n=1 Tax=Rhodococcus sp. NPDC060176 TaxID=3347062 RepID=UPI003660452A